MLVQAEIETLRPNQGEHPLPSRSTPQPNPCINMQNHPRQSQPIHQSPSLRNHLQHSTCLFPSQSITIHKSALSEGLQTSPWPITYKLIIPVFFFKKNYCVGWVREQGTYIGLDHLLCGMPFYIYIVIYTHI